MNDTTLQEIIDELPDTFVNMVMQETDVARLQKKLEQHHCYNRRAVIKARIENLHPLL